MLRGTIFDFKASKFRQNLWCLAPICFAISSAFVIHSKFTIYRFFPFMPLPFGDLAYLTYTADCFRHTPNWTLETPSCDPYNRPGNYPILLVRMFAALGARKQDTYFLGILFFVILTVVAVLMSYSLRYELTRILPNVVWTLFWISPTTLLLVERGNIDLLIVILLLPFLLSRKRHPIYLLGWLSACALKLFPLVLVPLLLIDKNRRSWEKLFAIFSTLAVLLMNFKDLGLIFNRTYQIPDLSFGVRQPFYLIQYLSKSNSLPPKFPITSILTFLIIAFAADYGKKLLIVRKLWISGSNRLISTETLYSAFLFLGIFLLGNSFDYRFIFFLPLLFCVLKKEKNNSTLLVYCSIIMFFNQFSFEKLPIPFVSDMVLYLFCIYMYSLVTQQTLGTKLSLAGARVNE